MTEWRERPFLQRLGIAFAVQLLALPAGIVALVALNAVGLPGLEIVVTGALLLTIIAFVQWVIKLRSGASIETPNNG